MHSYISLYIIHHIKRLWRGVRSLAKDMVSINHEVDQASPNSIQVSGLRGIGGPEHAKQSVGLLRKPKSVPYDHLLIGAGVKWGKLLLLIVLSINMHPSPTRRGGTLEFIPQESGEVNKVGVANIFSGHPSHG
jgi:hypothetical protein